jgi:hypothetical protein
MLCPKAFQSLSEGDVGGAEAGESIVRGAFPGSRLFVGLQRDPTLFSHLSLSKTARHELEISSEHKFMHIFVLSKRNLRKIIRGNNDNSEFIIHNNFTGNENRLMKNLEAKNTRGLTLAGCSLFLDHEIPHGLNKIRHYWPPFRESDNLDYLYVNVLPGSN